MRAFVSLLLLSILAPANYAQRQLVGTGAADHAIVNPRKVVITRRSELIKNFPEKKHATITHPVISGLKDARVLRRVQSILQIKNVFDSTIAEYRDDAWLEEFSYEVNYNKNSILDITFSQTGSGAYLDDQSRHFAINLKNGRVFKASDVFVVAKFGALAALVDAELQDELEEIARENAKEMPDYQEIVASQGELKFAPKNLDDFSVSAKGITFLFDAGYPHVIRAFEPGGQYFVSFEELKPYIKPDGALGQFIH
ncbi:MAG TPA: hypothetical protein VGO56_19045 [Pyrinomonadaceae bacterium]|jgi:hypothetical protein|nr:hypothetical protein [Pyrinomonadaceae bacterium]